MNNEFTHFDKSGNAIMVDVSEKEITSRLAVAKGRITLNKETFDAIEAGTSRKGDVLGVARVAGIMAAKRTWELIPLCHPLMLTKCTIDFVPNRELLEIEARCTVKVNGITGVEMEALTAVSVALLTIYDMCKAIDRSMQIKDICLCRKSGGKSGDFINENENAK